MRSVNKVILIGNLGADPELRHTPGGTPVCNFRLATNERYVDAQGETQERTEWHRLFCFGRLAETAATYLRKGRRVYVEGTLRSRSYKDASGVERYVTEIKVVDLVLLDAPGEKSAQTSEKAQATRKVLEEKFDAVPVDAAEDDDPDEAGSYDPALFEDDLPF